MSPSLFNLYAKLIMRNAGLDELQVGIKIGRRNINNLRYVDYTTLNGRKQKGTKESKQKELKMRVKEESERAGLRLNIKKLRSWHLASLLLLSHFSHV